MESHQRQKLEIRGHLIQMFILQNRPNRKKNLSKLIFRQTTAVDLDSLANLR